MYCAVIHALQIVDDDAGIAVLRPAATNRPVPRGRCKGPSTTVITEAGVRERLGVQPAQVNMQG